MSAPAAPDSVTVIEPPKGAAWPDWRDLWAHRELLYVLAKRDVAVLYKQSYIGAFWAVMQPLLLATVFSVFFGLLADIETGTSTPYPVFAVLGMVTWLFFTSSLLQVSNSTVTNGALISKVYFPRLIIPISSVLAPTIDFGFGFLVALVVTFAYGVVPPVQVVLAPLLVPLILAVALGFGFWLAAIHVKYHDIGNLVSFIVLVGLFISPIVYPFSSVPPEYQPFYAINPMVGVLELMRWIVLPDSYLSWKLAIVPFVESAFLIVTGILYFGRAERSFADVI
jgi:lipopolysaccharide transport system permease protein